MIQRITVEGREIHYTLYRSVRARSMRISIKGKDNVVVSVPTSMSEGAIERFVVSKSHWILSKLEYLMKLPEHVFIKSSKKDFETYKASALVLATKRIEYFNLRYGFTYKKITIRNQKTRWGSCSRTGALSFNYKIALLPAHLADYIIVHELCHRGEMNHSQRFWNLVAITIPNCMQVRRELNGTLKVS